MPSCRHNDFFHVINSIFVWHLVTSAVSQAIVAGFCCRKKNVFFLEPSRNDFFGFSALVVNEMTDKKSGVRKNSIR